MRNIPSCSLAALFCGCLLAQSGPAPESLQAWQYYKQVLVPAFANGGLVSTVLDVDALNQARPDGGDLRLYSAAGNEIPYVLRIRRSVQDSRPLEAREFNRGDIGNAAQLSLDLGPEAHEHNEVDIRTDGVNFRRRVDVEGSADGNQWSSLAARQIIFRFSVNGPEVLQQAVRYPVSRYRYLRVKVSADPEVDRGTPIIEGVTVLRSMQVKAELLSFAGKVSARQPDRQNGRPASIWSVDFGGRIPIDSVVLTTFDGAFSRPYRLEDDDDTSAPVLLSSGDLLRRQDANARNSTISIPEHRARTLKLTITDDRNPPLNIGTIVALSAAREMVFQAMGSVQLYYGNPKAIAPHYDFAERLSPLQHPVRGSLGVQKQNPAYRPEAKPLSERSPWLVYVVLIAACLALGAILLSLMREANRTSAELFTTK